MTTIFGCPSDEITSRLRLGIVPTFAICSRSRWILTRSPLENGAKHSVCLCFERALVLFLLMAVAADSHANTRYDWRLRFRTLSTPHFDVHAHQGEEALAERLGAIAEQVRSRFAPVFGVPRGRVQVILVDQTDLSNGSATPFPYDAIEITAVPPGGETLIGNTTDWLELVFTHEYTHILHLD